MDTLLAVCAGLFICTVAVTAFQKATDEFRVASRNHRESNRIAGFCFAAIGTMIAVIGLLVLAQSLTAVQIFGLVIVLAIIGAGTIAWRQRRQDLARMLNDLPGIRRIEPGYRVLSVFGLLVVGLLFMFVISLLVSST